MQMQTNLTGVGRGLALNLRKLVWNLTGNSQGTGNSLHETDLGTPPRKRHPWPRIPLSQKLSQAVSSSQFLSVSLAPPESSVVNHPQNVKNSSLTFFREFDCAVHSKVNPAQCNETGTLSKRMQLDPTIYSMQWSAIL